MWGKDKDQTFHKALANDEIPVEEKRAVSLLGEMLPENQFRQFLYTGMISSIGQYTGNHYIIVHASRTIQLDSLGQPKYAYCLHSPYQSLIPPTDDVISILLFTRFHEDRFLNVANRSDCEDEIWDSGVIDVRPWDIPTPDAEWIVTPGRPRRSPILIEALNPDNTISLPTENQVTEIIETPVDVNVRLARMEMERDAHFGDYRFPVSNFLNINMDRLGLTPLPIIDVYGKHITRGIACCIFSVDNLRWNVATVGSPHPRNGARLVNICPWDSMRQLDNAALLMLLSNWAELQQIRTFVPEQLLEWREHYARPLTKSIMSYQTYIELTNNERHPYMFAPIGEIPQEYAVDVRGHYRGRKILVDDRVSNLIISIPDAQWAGVIIKNGRNDCGLHVFDPRNIHVEAYHEGRIYPMNFEAAVELIYSGFPERNAIRYDIERCELEMRLASGEYNIRDFFIVNPNHDFWEELPNPLRLDHVDITEISTFLNDEGYDGSWINEQSEYDLSI